MLCHAMIVWPALEMTAVQMVSALAHHLHAFHAKSVIMTHAAWNQDSAWSTIVEDDNVLTMELYDQDILAR